MVLIPQFISTIITLHL